MHEIRFYRDPNGVQPAKECLKNLQNQNSKNARIQVKQIASYITLLQERGLSLNKNIIDKVNEKYNIWELRPGCNRVLFVAWIDGMFVLLHAFPKKTQKHLSEKSIKPFVKLKILGKGGLMMNNNAIGESWEEVKKELFSPEEIIEIDASAALMEQLIEARQAQGISQKRLEELSGVSQPVIARMEKGITSPQLSTLLKVLRPLGLTLKIVPVPKT